MNDELHEYGDPQIASYNHKIPRWLMWTYIICPVWGIIWFILYWNGIHGWLDRGHWNELEKAANTTFQQKSKSDS